MSNKSPLAKLIENVPLCTEIGERLTPVIWDSTVPIVVRHEGHLTQHGTGTLIQIAQRHFIVTAAHVLKGIREAGYEIVIYGKERGYISLVGPFHCLRRNSALGDDQFDLAIWELDQEVVDVLNGYRFLNLRDVDTSESFGPDLYCMCGFPTALSTSGNINGTPIGLTPHYLLSYPFQGETVRFSGYDPRIHLLLHGKPSDSVAIAGIGDMPALHGISGCGIWKTNYLAVGPERWTPEHAKLVAVETGIFSDAIKGTIWKGVATLIHRNFEDLHPSMGLHWPQQWPKRSNSF